MIRRVKALKGLGIEITQNDSGGTGFGLMAWSPASGYLSHHPPGLNPVSPWAMAMVTRKEIFNLLEIEADLLG